MEFRNQPIGWAAGLNHKDLLSLESTLVRLHNSKDPNTLSRGRMRATGHQHLEFSAKNSGCRMFYELQGERIVILNMGTNQETH